MAANPDPQAAELLDRRLLAGLAEDLGEPEIVAEMLGMFSEELPERLSAIAEAVALGDAGGIKRAAHGLASPSATLGLVGLCATCRELEHDPARADGALMVERIGSVAAQTEDAVAAYLVEIGPF